MRTLGSFPCRIHLLQIPDADALANAVLDAAARPYVQCVYPLFSKGRGGYHSEGSAVLAGRDRPELLISASHVLAKRKAQALYLGLNEQLLALNGQFRVLPSEGDDAPDVGVCMLDDSTIREADATAFVAPADVLHVDIADPASYVLVGYPHTKQSTFVRDGVLDATAMIFASHSVSATRIRELGFRPSSDLLVEFDKRDVVGPRGRFNAPDPTGASGGGVWYAPHPWRDASEQWRLAAIAIEWHRTRGKFIRATRLGWALRRLAQGRSAMDSLLRAFF